jgi:amino acid permease
LCLIGFGIMQQSIATEPLINFHSGTVVGISLLPDTIGKAFSLLGVCVYLFGFNAMVLPMQKDMKDPSKAMEAVVIAAAGVLVFYLVTSTALVALYADAAGGVRGNILQNLPTDSMLASIVRLSMGAVSMYSS